MSFDRIGQRYSTETPYCRIPPQGATRSVGYPQASCPLEHLPIEITNSPERINHPCEVAFPPPQPYYLRDTTYEQENSDDPPTYNEAIGISENIKENN